MKTTLPTSTQPFGPYFRHPPFWIEDWLVEPENHRLRRGARSVRLEPKVMHVLIVLARQAGQTVDKAALLETVWAGTSVGEKVVSRGILLLRRVLEDDPRSPRLLLTVPHVGYRLMAVSVKLARPQGSARRGSLPGPPRKWLGWTIAGTIGALVTLGALAVLCLAAGLASP